MDEVSPEMSDDDDEEDDDDDDDFDEDDEEHEVDVIEFEDENGKKEKYEILDELDFEGRRFAIILPYPEIQFIEADGENFTFLKDEELAKRLMEHLDEISEELDEEDED